MAGIPMLGNYGFSVHQVRKYELQKRPYIPQSKQTPVKEKNYTKEGEKDAKTNQTQPNSWKNQSISIRLQMIPTFESIKRE